MPSPSSASLSLHQLCVTSHGSLIATPPKDTNISQFCLFLAEPELRFLLFPTMSSTPYDIPALLKAIDTNGKSLGKDTGEARRQCLAAARGLCYALETPMESILRVSWAEV